MPSRTEKSLTHPLMAMLALVAFSAAVQSSIGKTQPNMAHTLNIVLKALASFSAFVWYCRDSDMRRYRRSLWRNILFNSVSLLFVPWYLLRTRPRGKRLAALLSLGGVGLLLLVALVAGAGVGFIVRKLV